MGTFLRHSVEGRISGRRPSGRHHQKILDWIIDKVNRKACGHLKEKAQLREQEVLLMQRNRASTLSVEIV